jgi:hypothetical protein
VFNLPATKDSKLAMAVQQVLDTVPGPTGSKIRVQERPGRSVRSTLCSANPFPRPSCGRLHCPWTQRGEDCRERCYRESVGYAARCCRCRAEQEQQGIAADEIRDQVYIGESSRSLPTRAGLHYRDYGQDIRRRAKRRRPGQGEGEVEPAVRQRPASAGEEEEEGGEGRGVSSWMADHTRERHAGVISTDPVRDYQFEITGTFMKPLHRQVDEALRIDRAERTAKVSVGKDVWRLSLPMLNRKHEYWAPRNMIFTFSNYNRDRDTRGEGR